MSKFWKVLRGIFVFLFKFLILVLAIAFGAILAIWSWLWLWTCDDRKKSLNKKCETRENMKAGANMVVWGFVEIADLKRVVWDDVNEDNLTWFHGTHPSDDRRRSLAQGGQTMAETEDLTSIKFEDYPEDTPAQVISATIKDCFADNRKAKKLISEAQKIIRSLRQGYKNNIPKDTIKDSERPALSQQINTNFIQAKNLKIKVFKTRIKRIVFVAAKKFFENVESEINPEKFSEKRKKEYDALKAELKETDPKKVEKAEKKLKEFGWKYNPENPDSKEEVTMDFGKQLVDFGFTKKDGQSSYSASLINAAMSIISKRIVERIKLNKDDESAKDVNPDEMKTKITQMAGIKLPDNTAVNIEKTIDEDEGEGEDENGGTG